MKLIRDIRPYLTLLLLALVVVTWVLVWGSRPVSGQDKTPVRVTIEKGTTAKEVAAVLKEKGLIRSPFVFSLTCRFSDTGSRLKPGAYEFSRSMSIQQIIQKLVTADTLESWFTVPEGYTVRQIADLLAAKKLAQQTEFVDMALTRGYEFPKYGFVYDQSLEGYLFPETYLVGREDNPQQIIRAMLDVFRSRVLIPYKAEIQQTINKRFSADNGSFNTGLHKIITLASIVEREAKVPVDRPLVAAVLWNRLSKNMRLEVDATISYRPGESTSNKERVLYRDLESDSAYNTYKINGLPPGPICNPGLAAIQAVLRPASVDYLYYVAKPDGSHVFSRTYEQHLKARNAIRNEL